MRIWTFEEATAALPEVRALVQRLRAAVASGRAGTSTAPSGNGHGPSRSPLTQEVGELLAALDERGIIVRDAERGLIDFPAQAPDGRTYLLCWLDGEDEIAWWHWPEDGFAGRTPLTEPPT